ncbi:putative enterotoxin [Ophiocordyceps unilateralis]|uniref:Enterotoxin n=1 Tax=Ophiocordyceps unilateralis TaxID=268505 RepID=A0A2A9PH84_OPHUN|nr:putative enterotoxin [Ophiocordyceps unilateralis]
MGLSYVVLLALLSSVCPTRSLLVGRPPGDNSRRTSSPPRVVYRADKIHPIDLELQNGFLPRGLDGSRPNAASLDFSLYNHVLGTPTGSSTSTSAFVATSKSEMAARRILSLSLSDVGFIYHIHVTSNFYDVEGSLGGYYMHTSEEEVAALGRIKFTQVLGWIEFRQGVEQPFVKNSKYKGNIFDAEVWAGTEYRLAGFPENHAAWKREPWKSVKEGEPLQIPCSPRSWKRHISCDLVHTAADKETALQGDVLKLFTKVDAKAETLFVELASKFGLMARASVSWRMSLPEVRERFKKSGRYLPIQQVTTWTRGGIAATATGELLYNTMVSGMQKMSDLDRAAVLTSILPGVGCSFQAFAAEARGKLDFTDVMFCMAADVLMIQGLGLPFLAVDALRSIRKKYLESKMPSPSEMQKLRDEGWQKYQASMIAFIRSMDFIILVNNHFMAEMAGVMFEAAEALTRLHVIKQDALKGAKSREEEANFLRLYWKRESILRSSLSSQAWQRHERMKSELPQIIKRSLENQAKEFNRVFIKKFEHDVKTNKYESWAPWGITTAKLERNADAIVRHLQDSQPATPNVGEIVHRVHGKLAYLETPSFCTEYRPDGGITFRCGDPSDGDNHMRGSADCKDEACTVYRPPPYQNGCELGYLYNRREHKCRRLSPSSPRDSAQRQLARPVRNLHQPPCTEYRADGGINFHCGGPTDGDMYQKKKGGLDKYQVGR